jgi:hypothetical protein
MLLKLPHPCERQKNSAARAAGAKTNERLMHRSKHRGVLAHTELIIGAPHGDFTRATGSGIGCSRFNQPPKVLPCICNLIVDVGCVHEVRIQVYCRTTKGAAGRISAGRS